MTIHTIAELPADIRLWAAAAAASPQSMSSLTKVADNLRVPYTEISVPLADSATLWRTIQNISLRRWCRCTPITRTPSRADAGRPPILTRSQCVDRDRHCRYGTILTRYVALMLQSPPPVAATDDA